MVVKGKQLTLKERWQKLKSELHGMTFKEKMEHLWEYYKWVLGVVLILVVIIATIVSSVISVNTETIIAGALINVDVSMEGYNQLQDGYYERAKTEGRQMVGLNNFNFVDPYSTTDQTYSLDVLENVTGMIGSDLLDYVLYDDVALEYFMVPEWFADLREYFTQEELEAMGSAVIWLEMTDTGDRMPIAIDIRDTAFYQEYIDNGEPVYLSFSVRTPRKEACLDFWQFLKGGQTESLQTVLAGSTVDVTLNSKSSEFLTEDFFKAEAYTPGDHRVELTQQSLRHEEEAVNETILGSLNSGLETAATDYLLCDGDALNALDQTQLMDLRLILSEEELTRLGQGLIWREDVPVAVDISGLAFYESYGKTEGPVYLVFSANTQKTDACKALWSHMAGIQ